MSAINLYLIYFSFYIYFSEAYNILVVFPYPGRSHGNLGDGVVRNLLRDGHEVTYITPFTYTPASPRLRMIDVSSNAKLLPDNMYNLDAIINKQYKIEDHRQLFTFLIKLMKHTTQNENVEKILSDPQEKFDAVIIEWFFTELLAGYAVTFNCPLIWVSGLDTHWYILRLIDQPSNPAYTADVMSSLLPPFTFWERAAELYTQLKVLYVKYMYFNEIERQEYEDLFSSHLTKRGRQLPNYYDIQFNTSLILSNSHVSLGKALAVPQNYIHVGGYHINDVMEPLSGDLKKLLDNAENGVIYFSMGSNLKSKDIPKVLRDSLLKMFSGLKQTVLWKFEENLAETPHNVHIIKWAPQHSILAHPNTVLFITHGGLLSTIETIHYGVPIIGIPIYGDQYTNIKRSMKSGFAIRVDFSYKIAEDLKLAIKEIMKNSQYADKTKELSFIYHDRPIPPGKELVHWVRHVIQTQGALHLRSPTLEVPFYKKFYLDLFALVLFIMFIIARLIKYLFYCIIKSNFLYIHQLVVCLNKIISFKKKKKENLN